MNVNRLLFEVNKIFRNEKLTDDDAANELLDLMDSNRETVEAYRELNAAYRVLNIWSRTETETGTYLDQVQQLLALEGKE